MIGVSMLAPAPATAQWPYESWDFDIVGVSVSPSTVDEGESTTVTVSIQNVGSEIGTVSVYFGVQRPIGGREYFGPRKIFDIPVGQTRSLSWPYMPSAGAGQYWVDFDVYSPPETHMFDTTGFVHSLTVSSTSESDPTATRNSPSAMVTVEPGASQTFVADLYDPDCDLHATEWYLEDEPETGAGTLLGSESPAGCTSSSSWTRTFPSEGTFEIIVQVYDSRYSGQHMDQTNWIVNVTEQGGAEPEECSKSADGRFLRFSGWDWEIKSGDGRGPGPNNWDRDNVTCDANGHLHLKITNEGGTWRTAEVFTTQPIHFGHYEFRIAPAPLHNLHERVVLGLFNYGPPAVGPDGTNEIDIEFSRWANTVDREPGQFVVYPSDATLRPQLASQRFWFDPVPTSTTHRFFWQSDHVTFESIHGSQRFHWRYTSEEPARRIPQAPLPMHMNLWLYRGPDEDNPVPDSAITGAATEIVIEDFSWHAEAMPASFRLPLPLPLPIG